MFDSSMNFAKIRVVGVGGAGNNAINRMIESGIQSADFYAINTDKQPLILSKAENIIQIGQDATQGLGAGSDPELGERAAEENRKELEEMCEGVNLLFIAAGMGGGTGTGAAPVIAKIAKEKGCLTVAVVTKPFAFEGRKRQENAAIGISNLKKYVDTLIIIPNDKLIQTLSADTPMLDALKVADDNLRQGICGIADLIATPALINLDFADVKTIIQNQGLAHMGRGRAKGENRIIEAVRQAVSSPLLETTIEGAHGVIINVTGGRDLTIGQVNEAARLVQSVVDESANIIFGANIDFDLSEEIDITVIATGFEGEQRKEEEEDAKANPMQAFEILMKKNKTEPAEPEQPQPEPEVYAQPEEEEVDFEQTNKQRDNKELPSFVKKLFGKK